MQSAQVVRVDRLAPDELERDFLAQERPVVLTKVLPGWAALRAWTFESLKEQLGEGPLAVRGGDRNTWRRLGHVGMTEYVDFLTQPEKAEGLLRERRGCNPYAAFQKVGLDASDYDFESLFPEGFEFTGAMLWMGPAGALTPLHYDASGATALAQLRGRKQCLLFPFSQSAELYPSDIFDWQSVFSDVNLDAPDLSRHPRYGRIRPIEVVLEPGEILIIPNKMWHQMRALDASMSLTRRTMRRRRFSPELVHWYLKGTLHLLGLYKKGRCLCHIEELTEKEIAPLHWVIKLLVRFGGQRSHGRDLAEMIGWKQGTPTTGGYA